MLKRFSEILSLRDVDSDKFQNTILCNHADHHRPLRFIICIHERNPAGAGFEHAAACFVQRAKRMNGDSLNRRNVYVLLNN